ncbi:HupE/UreJ family protein [Microlunatus antarcticus]|uniref:HupE / UreJ protein n=1 Tax=Microlunatus antarcticus TaxID=53388 RepID=A0A7W5JXR5_9ACTN|nr:HupE/UreJ family protein [Microlunatus antarcticus]MBB3328243.1 hypothetical protein [Microlunatus antarcticus]
MRTLTRALAAVSLAFVVLVLGTGTASAHVLPTSTVQLVVGADAVEAQVSIPVDDLTAASGLDLGDASEAAVTAQASAIDAYLVAHVRPTSDDGRAWSVVAGAPTVSGAGDARTTGLYREVRVLLTLTPPAGADVRSFDLGYDAVVDRVATHTVIVTVSSDWSGGQVSAPYEVGTVVRDTVTGTVVPLHVDLGSGSDLRGLTSMVVLGIQHIREGTDHQLFLLTLLLPAPLLVSASGPRRWGGPVTARSALGRIARITLAFTFGHSVTLAAGAIGVPVPQQAVEVLIAVSILVAAVHAGRPLFPGREALVAGCFGLVHGLAFSETLRALDLTGGRLVLSLVGFNLGIELMQLVVVALVLPPLVLLARAGRYSTLRVGAAALTGVAAIGWVLARLGVANPVADLADRLGSVAVLVVVVLWVVALLQVRRSGAASAAGAGRRGSRRASPGSAPATTPATRG